VSRPFLAEESTKIKVLRQVDLLWKTCLGHAFDIGRIAQEQNLFRFHVAGVHLLMSHKQFRHVLRWRLDAEMERLGYRTASSTATCTEEASALWCLYMHLLE
jgi:hypothetical protein